MAEKFEPPTTDESRRFLISFPFNGSMTPGLRECVWRAYLDLSRTVHGVGKLPDSKNLKSSAHELLERLLKELRNERPLGMANRMMCGTSRNALISVSTIQRAGSPHSLSGRLRNGSICR